MTAIAYRDGIFVADTAEFDGEVFAGHVEKIVKYEHGYAASAGTAGTCEAFNGWLASGRRIDLKPEIEDERFVALIVKKDGSVWRCDDKFIPYQVNAPFHALGCSEFLLGAMVAGMSAEEAVRSAIKYHAFADGDVQVVRVGKGEAS